MKERCIYDPMFDGMCVDSSKIFVRSYTAEEKQERLKNKTK